MKRWLAALLLAGSGTASALPDIQVQGLMPGRAVLTIDGSMQILREGETSPEGITIIAADSQSVTFDYRGERHQLGLTARAGAGYQTPERARVTIPRDAQGHYFTGGRINGRSVPMLVDTGATDIVLNSRQADALGIDYRDGAPGMVATASGMTTARQVELREVSVGDITLYGVRATIIDGEFPVQTLLGNSFLQRVDLRQEQGMLIMESKF